MAPCWGGVLPPPPPPPSPVMNENWSSVSKHDLANSSRSLRLDSVSAVGGRGMLDKTGEREERGRGRQGEREGEGREWGRDRGRRRTPRAACDSTRCLRWGVRDVRRTGQWEERGEGKAGGEGGGGEGVGER